MELALLTFLVVFVVVSWLGTTMKNVGEEARRKEIAKHLKAYEAAAREFEAALKNLQAAVQKVQHPEREIKASWQVLPDETHEPGAANRAHKSGGK